MISVIFLSGKVNIQSIIKIRWATCIPTNAQVFGRHPAYRCPRAPWLHRPTYTMITQTHVPHDYTDPRTPWLHRPTYTMITQICFVEVRKPNVPESCDIFWRTPCMQQFREHSVYNTHLNGTQQNSSGTELARHSSRLLQMMCEGIKKSGQQQRSNKCRFFTVARATA
jgi:hypothetical protein